MMMNINKWRHKRKKSNNTNLRKKEKNTLQQMKSKKNCQANAAVAKRLI